MSPANANSVATVRTRCSKCEAWNSFEADEKIDAVACGECSKPIGLDGVSEKLITAATLLRTACAISGVRFPRISSRWPPRPASAGRRWAQTSWMSPLGLPMKW